MAWPLPYGYMDAFRLMRKEKKAFSLPVLRKKGNSVPFFYACLGRPASAFLPVFLFPSRPIPWEG